MRIHTLNLPVHGLRFINILAGYFFAKTALKILLNWWMPNFYQFIKNNIPD